ncbi:MAG: VCBS repeat-containing protein [Isosphaeraceae bacterium]|nr:VCBS repeat-containing protein [Isosphaeraceae bacterium]
MAQPRCSLWSAAIRLGIGRRRGSGARPRRPTCLPDVSQLEERTLLSPGAGPGPAFLAPLIAQAQPAVQAAWVAHHSAVPSTTSAPPLDQQDPAGAPLIPPPAVAMTVPTESGRRVSFAVSDLDGDGLLDFVFADQAEDQLVQTFGSGQTLVLSDHQDGIRAPGDVLLADLNDDGLKDLIVANTGADAVLIYPGLGNGRFGPEVNGGQGFPVGIAPTGITVADVNQDGIPDLLVADSGSSDVCLLVGQGRGAGWTLTPAGRFRAGAGPLSTAVWDINGDGRPDLLVSNSLANSISLLRNLGGGRFDDRNPTIFPVGKNPVQILVGHFDRHSLFDLITLDAGSDDLTMISHAADGSWVSHRYPSGGVRPVAALALDGDNGVMNLIVANNGDGRLSLFRGGDGLQLASSFVVPTLPHPTALAFSSSRNGVPQIYAATEGRNVADLLSFPIDEAAPSPSPVGPTELPAPARFQPPELSDSLTSGPPPIALLLPLQETALDLVGVLLTVWHDAAWPPIDLEIGQVLAVSQGTTAARPSQGISHSEDHPGDEAEEAPGSDDSTDVEAEPARTAQQWERLVLGLDEAFDAQRRAAQDESFALDDPADAAELAQAAPTGWCGAASAEASPLLLSLPEPPIEMAPADEASAVDPPTEAEPAPPAPAAVMPVHSGPEDAEDSVPTAEISAEEAAVMTLSILVAWRLIHALEPPCHRSGSGPTMPL